jgi:hypothetical protein
MNSVADPDPISSGFLMFGSGISNKKKIQIRDENPGVFSRELRNNLYAKIFLSMDRDLGSFRPGSGIHCSRMEKFGSGIQNKHPGSATLCMNISLRKRHYLNGPFSYLKYLPI